MTKKRKITLIVLGVLILLCLAISGIYLASPSGKTEKTADASKPTLTPIPSQTPAPTEIPAPTNTPRPTNTPVPTIPPTQPPEPILLSGSGDSIADIQKWDGAALLHVIGPNAQDNFAVTSYDQNNQYLELLVNTIGAYDGYLLIDYAGEQTTRFEISAAGPWTIEVYPVVPEYMHMLTIPGAYTGQGDDVVVLTGGTPDTAIVQSINNQSNFAVYAIGVDSGVDLLVNEIGNYTGTVLLSPDVIIITVHSEGDWSVQVATR